MKYLFPPLLFTFLLLSFTGKAQQNNTPVFNNRAEKDAWIKEHLQNNNPGNNKGNVNTDKNKKEETKGTSKQLVNEPGFPQYIDTGNKEKDDANYKAAKEKWIQEHPDRYKQMTSQPK
ncbi:MAG TPA: hypothetical protein VI112_15475 [Bacteroidia bacterium]